MILPFAPPVLPGRRGRSRGRSAARGAGCGSGRIVQCDDAGAVVASPSGTLRATWGPHVLAAMAGGPACAPLAGQVADWFRWPDGRVTVERVRPAA